MRDKTKASIIVANYNGEEYLEDSISSVLKQGYKNFELIIVDDGSTDSSIKIIRNFIKKDKRVRVYKNKKNLGASASRNKAAKRAKGEILVFLDNDTYVEKNWLENLISQLEANNIGAVQSLILDYHNRNKVQMAGGVLIPHVGWLAPFSQGKDYKKNKSKIKRRPIVAISAALAVKKTAFMVVDGFDVKEAVTTEDLDFCWRLWIAGYKIFLAPQSIVYHWSKSVENRKTMGATYKKIYFHLSKNSFRSIIKNYETINVIKYLPISLLVNFGRGAYFALTNRGTAALQGSFKGLFWNLINMGDTISSRKKVQATRKLSDKYLLNQVFTRKSLQEIYKKYYK